VRTLSDHPVFPILLSTDLAASRAFYHDTLGLEILGEDDGRRPRCQTE
jgi:catechol 2,3-dioxygenase-like lactoylglutathione lyase family enzyme